MGIKELLKFKGALEKFVKAEKELIKTHSDVFCDQDFQRIRALIESIKEIKHD